MNKGVKAGTLPLLTEMRGIAALLMFTVHLGFYLPFFHRFNWAYLGVDFFFILSGFVLTHVYCDWFYPNFRPRSFRDFAWARFGRVYPLHFFYCGLYLLLTGLLLAKWPIKGFLYEVFVMNALPRWRGQDPVSWSISCECVAYFFAPFLIHFLTAQKPWRIAVAMLGSTLWLFYVVIFHLNGHNLDVHSVALRCLPEFTLGICCYQISKRWPPGNRLAVLLSIASFATIVMALVLMPEEGARDLVCTFSFCLLIPSSVYLRGTFVRLFNLLFGYLGEISYSIYWVHPMWLLAATPLLIRTVAHWGVTGSWATALVYAMMIPLVIGSSALSYHFIELPTRSFFKRLSRRPAPDRPPASATPGELAMTPVVIETQPDR